MPICIAGMHRSGTSMVTRLLQACGLQLGPPEAMIPAAPDNPEGFFEHRGFLTLNDEVLASLRGSWSDPPPALADDWAALPAIAPHRDRAQAFLAQLGLSEPWGWKDPRNALTIAFWRALLPDLRVVVCVRHPGAVVGSMQARGGQDVDRSAWLYRSYHETLLAAVPSTARVVTHYEAYFADPARELTRVCAALDMRTTPAVIDAAVTTIQPRLNHHAAPPDAVVPPDVLRFYLARLRDGDDPDRAPANPHRESLLQSHVFALDASRADQDARCAALSASLEERSAAHDAVAARLADATEALAARDAAVATLQQRLATERGEQQRLEAALAALHDDARQLRAEVQRLGHELDTVTGSRAWRLVERLWDWRLRVAPRGSRRERWLPRGSRRA